MNKACTKCGEVKPSDYFNKNKSIKCGLTSACKACRKEDYGDNQESERASSRAYYAKNREAVMLKHRAYRQAKPVIAFLSLLASYQALVLDLVHTLQMYSCPSLAFFLL